jgi:hypothetical protein
MSCHDIRPLLDDLLDGELEAAAENAVKEHLAVCPACRAELERGQRLARQTAALPRALEPTRDLWPGIALEIGAQRRPVGHSTWSVWLGTAAAAAMLAAVLTGMLASGRGAGDPMPLPSTVAAVDPAAGELERAREALRGAFEQRRGSLSDDTVRVVLEAVDVIDRSIEAIGGALERHPGDAGLARRLQAAYRQEIQLLQRATRLPDET